jgi:hypothetical protein
MTIIKDKVPEAGFLNALPLTSPLIKNKGVEKPEMVS